MATHIPQSQFGEKPKACKECHRILQRNYSDEICPTCKDRELFSKVKDFIRANDVTEYDVADYFEIPLQKVKGWIREGRIQYKDLNIPTLALIYCERCGEQISFGTLCTKCQRKATTSGSTVFSNIDEDQRFRYL